MIINASVNHKKWGNGIITNLEVDSENMLKSKITVEFDDGYTTKFILDSLKKGGFLSIEDDEVNSFIEGLEAEKAAKDEAKRIERIRKAEEAKIRIPHYNLDETEREVTIEDWKKAYKVAESYRFAYESRAVTNGDLVFINASAAMRVMGANVKACDNIYKSCENGKKYLDNKWMYASKEVIENIIKEIEGDNDIK